MQHSVRFPDVAIHSQPLTYTAPQSVFVAECDSRAQLRRALVQGAVQLKLKAQEQAHQRLDGLLQGGGDESYVIEGLWSCWLGCRTGRCKVEGWPSHLYCELVADAQARPRAERLRCVSRRVGQRAGSLWRGPLPFPTGCQTPLTSPHRMPVDPHPPRHRRLCAPCAPAGGVPVPRGHPWAGSARDGTPAGRGPSALQRVAWRQP